MQLVRFGLKRDDFDQNRFSPVLHFFLSPSPSMFQLKTSCREKMLDVNENISRWMRFKNSIAVVVFYLGASWPLLQSKTPKQIQL